VTSVGCIERDDAGLLLWVAGASEPRWADRRAGGVVAVRLDRAGAEPWPDGELVEVSGVWTGDRIARAAVVPCSDPVVPLWRAPATSIGPEQLGGERYLTLSCAFRDRAGTPILSSGGTDRFLWYHVLRVTPALVEAHRAWPVTVDIFAAIAPTGWPRVRPALT
jgi:hypothetical protein